MNHKLSKTYWNGYHAMKRLAYDYHNADKAYMEIYNSNASNEFVRGAERAWRYIKRVGVQNITAQEAREPIFSGTAYEYIEKFGKGQQ